MKSVVRFMAVFLLFESFAFTASAGFTNLFVFGDGLSTTTNNPSPGPQYYGKRYSNGRVWVEVLAQRQGLVYDANKNWSYFYNSSTTMLANVSSFQVPSDASNALFVIWVNCADLWFPATYSGTNLSPWTNNLIQSQTNHFKAATNLYLRGVRTLIMPNAVDLASIPEFNGSVNANFIHLRCLDYNFAFSNTVKRIRTACPDLTLITPDFFTLLTNLISHPANYGVTNALGDGLSIDAIHAFNFNMPTAATNGFGTNFIFWNENNPTAMVHTWMANLVQQLVSPAQISRITALNGSNRLDLVSVPIGQNGLVIGCTNLGAPAWKTNLLFSGTNTFITTNTTQTIYVLSSSPGWYYRLSFPYSWKWP